MFQKERSILRISKKLYHQSKKTRNVYPSFVYSSSKAVKKYTYKASSFIGFMWYKSNLETKLHADEPN